MSKQDQAPDEIIEGEVTESRQMVVSGLPSADQYMPALSTDQAAKRLKAMQKFVKDQMRDGVDFGSIGGISKPTLLKPGAEKLTTLFGLSVRFIAEKTIERWEDEDPFFFYQRKCQLWRGDLLIAEASGSANSKESRYRWRWVSEAEIPPHLDPADLKTRGGTGGEWQFAVSKKETTGRYGKPAEYWEAIEAMLQDGRAEVIEKEKTWGEGGTAPYVQFDKTEYRVPNDEVFSLVNTLIKMAEKRALVAATLIGCNASEFFTQDVEDGMIADDPGMPASPPAQAQQRQSKQPKSQPTNADARQKSFRIAGKYRNENKGAMPPDKLKQFLLRLQKINAQEGNDAANDNQRGLVVGMLNTCFDGTNKDKDKARHSFLAWVFDEPSTNGLPGDAINALLDWMQASRPSEGDPYVMADYAIKEARAAYKQILIDEGQTEMPLDESEGE